MKMVNRKFNDRNKGVTIIIAQYCCYSNNCAGAAVIIVRPVKRTLVKEVVQEPSVNSSCIFRVSHRRKWT